jgi:Uncharacterized conserved protein
MKYTGSCHCQAIRFEADVDLEKTITCNCSYCSRRGFILTAVDGDKFTLLTPEAPMTEYRFNTHKIKHEFCPVCGLEPFASGTNKEGVPMYMVNVRCLDGIDLDSISPMKVNGKDF